MEFSPKNKDEEDNIACERIPMNKANSMNDRC